MLAPMRRHDYRPESENPTSVQTSPQTGTLLHLFGDQRGRLKMLLE
ncbi:MAG: hypothetical protein KKG92_04985 [Gammaproteobacteria bacterium]|nr:hypothetical protein [Gammaproteobacteria bacterium]